MNFDPIHWLCVILVIVVVGLGIFTKIISTELKLAEVSMKGVEIVGIAQEKETKKEDKESKESKEKVDEVARVTIAKLQSDNDRMRKQITSSRSLPATPQTCTGGGETTTIDWPLVEREVDNFRIRARDLVEEGDKNREGLDAVKQWVEDELE